MMGVYRVQLGFFEELIGGFKVSHNPCSPQAVCCVTNPTVFRAEDGGVLCRSQNATGAKRLGRVLTGLLLLGYLTPALAQDPAPAARRGGRRNGPTELWWVNKPAGDAYKSPMRPLWKLSDLKKMHAGRDNWAQQIIFDDEQDVTYNSAARGTAITPRMHPDTPTVFVVIAGEMRFSVEGQEPVTAKRGSIIHVLKSTIYSYEVTGSQNALWVEDDIRGYSTVYPASGPKPENRAGGIAKVSFSHSAGTYTRPNRLHFNTLDAIADCTVGPAVQDDHMFANPLLGYVNPADNKCGTGSGNIGGGRENPGAPPFDAKIPFGHLHSGAVEWWIVQVGAISGKFENHGEFHATEGDVLYAAPGAWHEMAAEAPSGPSVRLAMGAYQRINMQNTGSEQ
jgi:mannose-6-phosphate isomerase-like protein (cupin superfamily)